MKTQFLTSHKQTQAPGLLLLALASLFIIFNIQKVYATSERIRTCAEFGSNAELCSQVLAGADCEGDYVSGSPQYFDCHAKAVANVRRRICERNSEDPSCTPCTENPDSPGCRGGGGDAPEPTGAECSAEEGKICFASPFQGERIDGGASGTDQFARCNYLSSGAWGRMTSDRNANTSQIWAGAWATLGKATEEEVNQASDVNAQLTALQQNIQRAESMYKDLLSCEAYRSFTAGGNFDQQDGRGSPPRQRKSADGQITCRSCGDETQDYEACVNAVNAYDGAMIGQVGFSGYQQISHANHTMNAQGNMDPNSHTSALQAQGSVIANQGDMANQQAAVSGGKAATFWGMMEQMPDIEDIEERCVQDARRNRINSRALADDLNRFVQAAQQSAAQAEQQLNVSSIQSLVSNADNDLRRQCREQLANSCVINNAEAKDKMKQAAMSSGIEALVELAKAALLHRQANQIKDLVDEIDGFSPEDLNYQPGDFFGSECELNPSAEGCSGFVEQRSYGFGDGSPIQIHGLTSATTFDRGEGDLSNNADQNVTGPSTDRSDVPRTFGTFDPVAQGSGGFSDRIPGAATVKDGGGNIGGGGGSPGGARGAGSPPTGGAGGNSNAPRMANPGTAAVSNSYGGGTGSLRLGGGQGAQGNARRPAAENPFNDMFGKKGGPQSDIMNFRDTASKEDIAKSEVSLFNIISNRYGAVQKSNRLLQYERD